MNNDTCIPDLEQYLSCSCYSELLRLQYEYEFKTLNLSIYGQQYSSLTKLSLKARIKRAFQILWNGREYSDQIILDQPAINKLSDFLKK